MWFGGATAYLASALTDQAAPAPLWRGVDEISVACTGDAAGLCAAAVAEAARGSPVPVRISTAAEARSGTLELRLDAARRDGSLLLTLGVTRPVSTDDAQGALLPRTTRVVPGERAEAALARALDGALPWRRAGTRHLLIQPPFRQATIIEPVQGRSIKGE